MEFSRYRRVREEADVNLIPVMNLFVTLIPFLLLGAAFFHVGVIPASLPSQTEEATTNKVNPRSVTVNLLIELDRIQLSVSSAVLDEATLADLLLDLERTEKGFDLDMLGKALQEIKRRYDQSDTVVVLPADTVRYEDIVKILDTAREMTIKGEDGQESRKPLFPVVVLSRKV